MNIYLLVAIETSNIQSRGALITVMKAQFEAIEIGTGGSLWLVPTPVNTADFLGTVEKIVGDAPVDIFSIDLKQASLSPRMKKALAHTGAVSAA